MLQRVLPYVTKFPSVLILADEKVKICYIDLFSRAIQKIMFRLY